jgi:hypothetical protein
VSKLIKGPHGSCRHKTLLKVGASFENDVQSMEADDVENVTRAAVSFEEQVG